MVNDLSKPSDQEKGANACDGRASHSILHSDHTHEMQNNIYSHAIVHLVYTHGTRYTCYIHVWLLHMLHMHGTHCMALQKMSEVKVYI